jgi:DNA-binding transcriptional regulator PaaX
MILYYKGIKVNNLGIPVFLLRDNKNIRIKNNRKRNYYNISFNSSFKSNQPKNLLVMYDIPTHMRRERDWFRRHLVKFGYMMIQKSVWVGPSPLPKDFQDYLKEIKISDNLKTFKLEKPYPLKK